MSQEGAMLAARWIAGAMKAAGISQSELARRMGISHPYISRILQGKSDTRMSTIVRALKACGCEILTLQVKPPKKLPLELQPS